MRYEEQLCIYISSPKSYKDVLDTFIKCKNKLWKDCPYDLVISTNHNLQISNAYVINSGDVNDSWVDRSLQALNQIDYKYVMLLCDDMFITQSIDCRLINEIVNYMDLYNLNFCRLKPVYRGKKIKEFPYLSYVNQNEPYGINLQRGIFRREYLIKLLGDGTQSVWDIEGNLLEQAYNAPKKPFKDVIACNKEIFPIIHGVEKGKWFPSAIKTLSTLGISVESNREILSGSIEFRQNLITYLSSRISPQSRKLFKLVAQKLGYKFTNVN